jgi:mRNA interferase RelE/StbE
VKYRIEILRAAQKQLAKIDRSFQKRIIDAVYDLAENPRPAGCQKLSGRPAWRIRVGEYRVIYEIHDNRLLILVVAMGGRKDIYRP